MGEVYTAALNNQAAAMNLQAATAPRNVNVWHHGTIQHNVSVYGY